MQPAGCIDIKLEPSCGICVKAFPARLTNLDLPFPELCIRKVAVISAICDVDTALLLRVGDIEANPYSYVPAVMRHPLLVLPTTLPAEPAVASPGRKRVFKASSDSSVPGVVQH